MVLRPQPRQLETLHRRAMTPPIDRDNCIVRHLDDGDCSVYDLSLYGPDDDLKRFYDKAKVGEFSAEEVNWLTDREIIDLCK